MLYPVFQTTLPDRQLPSSVPRMVQDDPASERWDRRKVLCQGLDVPQETDLQFFETSLPIPFQV